MHAANSGGGVSLSGNMEKDAWDVNIWVFPKIVGFFPPNHPWINRISNYFHHLFWGTPIFGNTHMKFLKCPRLASDLHVVQFVERGQECNRSIQNVAVRKLEIYSPKALEMDHLHVELHDLGQNASIQRAKPVIGQVARTV